MSSRLLKITAIEQKQRRKNEKKGQSKTPLGQPQAHQHSHYKGPRGRKERKGLR